MKYIVIENIEFSAYPGTNLKDATSEAFDWFYLSENSNVRTATLRHLNGVKVTFEREG
jgi:hypothetical protein